MHVICTSAYHMLLYLFAGDLCDVAFGDLVQTGTLSKSQQSASLVTLSDTLVLSSSLSVAYA